MKHREIALAVFLGAVAGTAVAIVCEFGLLMLLPSALIGALTAFLCYRPREVVATVREFSRDMKGAMQRGMQGLHIGKVLLMSMYVCSCAGAGLGSAILLPIVAYEMGIAVSASADFTSAHPLLFAVIIETSMSIVIGSLACCFFFIVLSDVRERWAMPITRSFRSGLQRWLGHWSIWRLLTENRECTTKKEVVLLWVMGPVFIQTFGSIIIVAIAIDLFLTILLACATSERVAAILGATLGICTGTVLHLCGVLWSPAILAASGIVGWYAGPLLYDLREYLSKVPITETVRS